jgi:hypothetical protein
LPSLPKARELYHDPNEEWEEDGGRKREFYDACAGIIACSVVSYGK